MRVLVDLFLLFKQKTAYDMRISDWSSDVCSADLILRPRRAAAAVEIGGAGAEHRPAGREPARDEAGVAQVADSQRDVVALVDEVGETAVHPRLPGDRSEERCGGK